MRRMAGPSGSPALSTCLFHPRAPPRTCCTAPTLRAAAGGCHSGCPFWREPPIPGLFPESPKGTAEPQTRPAELALFPWLSRQPVSPCPLSCVTCFCLVGGWFGSDSSSLCSGCSLITGYSSLLPPCPLAPWRGGLRTRGAPPHWCCPCGPQCSPTSLGGLQGGVKAGTDRAQGHPPGLLSMHMHGPVVPWTKLSSQGTTVVHPLPGACIPSCLWSQLGA